MDVLDEIKDIVTKLDSIEEYNSQLNGLLSVTDLKLQDLGHYIENNKLNARECCKIVAEMKKIRQDRRNLKNDMALLNSFEKHKNKLIETNNRQFLLAETNKISKSLNSKYVNRVYTEEELNEILGKEP